MDDYHRQNSLEGPHRLPSRNHRCLGLGMDLPYCHLEYEALRCQAKTKVFQQRRPAKTVRMAVMKVVVPEQVCLERAVPEKMAGLEMVGQVLFQYQQFRRRDVIHQRQHTFASEA